MMKTPPKVMTPVAARSTSLTRAIRFDAAAIRSRTPRLAVAMVCRAPGETSAPGAEAPADLRPGRGTSGYSSFFSSSATIAGESGR